MSTTKPHNEKVTVRESVEDILKVRGFHFGTISKTDADAVLRGEKTAIVVCSDQFMQKGDWFVCQTYKDNIILCTAKCLHEVNYFVFEVTYVKDIDGITPHKALVCFKKKEGYAFYEGGLSSDSAGYVTYQK